MTDIEAAPFCWVIPGTDTADMNGFIDARITCEGEFTRPLYTADTIARLTADVDRLERERQDADLEYKRTLDGMQDKIARLTQERDGARSLAYLAAVFKERAEAAEAKLLYWPLWPAN